MSLSVSSARSSARASRTVTVLRFFFPPKSPEMEEKAASMSSICFPANSSKLGPWEDWTRTSTSRSSSLPVAEHGRGISPGCRRPSVPRIGHGDLGDAHRFGWRPDAGKKYVQEAVLDAPIRVGLHGFKHLRLDHLETGGHQVAYHRLHVAADIADLGVLGRLDLHEGSAAELGQAPRYLRLADAGRPYHEDVLGGYLLPYVLRQELAAAHAVAQGYGDGPLGLELADDIAVQFLDDTRWG